MSDTPTGLHSVNAADCIEGHHMQNTSYKVDGKEICPPIVTVVDGDNKAIYDSTSRISEEDDKGDESSLLQSKLHINSSADQESESSEIDPTYFSDEDTSSLAGSFDEFGRDENDEDSYPSDQPVITHTREEKLRRQALRRHLDKLGDLVVEREYLVQKSREELIACRQKVESLEKELENVQEKIEEADASGSRAAYFRLNSQYEKVCSELKVEKDLEKAIAQKLDDAEFSLAQAYIEHGKFLPLDEELAKEEKFIEKQKSEKATLRVKKENAAAIAAERRRRLREKDNLSAIRERERKHRQAVTAARKNREIAMKYLKDTMSRVRRKESEEEERNRADVHNRMQALLSLRKNIEGNKENLKALQARTAQRHSDELKQEEMEREQILLQGLNPDEVLTRRKRLRQFDRDKEAFERKQREKEIEIADKILYEEKQMKKRHQQQPQLWQRDRAKRFTRKKPKPKFLKSSGSESMEYSADVEDTGGRLSQHSRLYKLSSDDDDFSPYGATSRDEAKTGESEEELLVYPEFKGLWEGEAVEENESNKTSWKTDTHEYSKLEQEMMENALEKQRANIVQKQIAAGREFKGAAFTSKPEVVVFKDFDVDKCYKKKVILTNVSYSQNFCKYTGMTENLKDFIEIQYSPPGPVSAGLTCDFTIIFKPLINEDLDGQLEFLAQSGPFSVPVKCFKKRCEMHVDIKDVDFGNLVIGETKKKSILLTNSGALGCKFYFQKIKGDTHGNATDDLISVGGLTTLDGQSVAADVESHADDQEVNDTQSIAGDFVAQNDHQLERELTEGDHVPEESKKRLSVGFQDELPIDQTSEHASRVEHDSLRTAMVVDNYIGPCSSVKLEIIFSPTLPCNEEGTFSITFDDTSVAEIIVFVKGRAIDVPVWVQREIVDMKICMFDRLYQDAVIINNRATSALRLRFEVPKELKNHMELLPRTAYIQAESQFSAQLKFLPRQSLAVDAPQYFDSSSGLLGAPLTIRVADQTKAVPFIVKAVVTSSDLEFNTNVVDFGHCTVFESVQHVVKLTNRSVLAQEYGFVGAPETIDIQPNDGFGTLLPEETVEMYIIFSPKKAREYKFDLVCKSGIGREFKLKVKAIGVLTPLELSPSLIEFKATAIGDSACVPLYVTNSHLSTNEFTHPVPRIGSGPVFPVGPTSFQFIMPENAPVKISPSVGTVKPGERCLVHVTFTPKLNESDVKKEAIKIKDGIDEAETKAAEAQAQENKEKEMKNRSKAKKGLHRPERNGSPSAVTRHTSSGKKSRANSSPLSEEQVGAEMYELARLSLLQSFEGKIQRIKVPCFMAFGECGDPESLEYSPHNTLYLELHCPAIKPALVVMSDNGRTSIDFGTVAKGDRKVKKVIFQNISQETLNLVASALDPFGPFEVLNAFRPLRPNASHQLLVSFSPKESIDFNEVLELRTGKSILRIRIRGKGMHAGIEISVKGEKFDVGDALVGDATSQAFELVNTSKLPLTVNFLLGSTSHYKHCRTQALEDRIPDGTLLLSKYRIGPNNYDGTSPFECIPSQCTLKPGEKKLIMINFAPDHTNEYFVDMLSIIVNEKVMRQVVLLARAWPNIVFTSGWDRMNAVESFAGFSLSGDDIEDFKNEEKTELLTFVTQPENDGYASTSRVTVIGCIKAGGQTKKSADFFFDGFKDANEKGFTFEPAKGGVDIGVKREVEFKWDPPNTLDPNKPVRTTVQLHIKGDVTLHYKIHLMGLFQSIVDGSSL